mmetsp:Transcript_31270/g.74322  ORF Transcript_31270/g.74322 Transcript_31270/m.74322 type:complete len:279 (+) Transcript_31270:303-1139(+)
MNNSVSTYETELLQGFGAQVKGVDLNRLVPENVIERIRRDTYKHRLLLFKRQGTIVGSRHVEVSKWFGPIESRPFSKHPKSPHPDVFRVSNVRSEGCTGVGRTGWHIDGSFMDCPYQVSVYHMHSVPKRGATTFLPLAELVGRMSKAQATKWERLWMCSDRQSGPVHPVIYRHPRTGLPTMCLHLGMTAAFVWDKDKPGAERVTGPGETAELLEELGALIEDNRDLVYTHEWEEGDLLITDNLALAHEATPDTQRPVSEVGLRVLHRTTVAGVHVPQK